MSDPLSYWDRQFKFSAVLPDFAARLEAVAQAPAPAGFVRLAYGGHARQWIEQAQSSGPAPGAPSLQPVLVHGGYWRALRAEDHRACLDALLALGAPPINVEYRLMPSARMGDLVSDVTAALEVAARRADGRRLLVIGHSAGAHLALEAWRRAGDLVAGVAALSGVYDLRPVPWSFLQTEIALTDGEIAAHSPLDAALRGAFAPERLWIGVGALETAEFVRQAQALSAASGAAATTIAAADHIGVLEALIDARSPLAAQLRAFAESVAGGAR